MAKEVALLLAGFAVGVIIAFKFAAKCVGLAIKQLIKDGLLKKGGS